MGRAVRFLGSGADDHQLYIFFYGLIKFVILTTESQDRHNVSCIDLEISEENSKYRTSNP